MFLLRDTGLINTALQALGIIREPLPLLYNDFAVLLGLVYGYLPFMVLPIYATLERLDPSLVEAAADLGARPLTTRLPRHGSALRGRASSPDRCWSSSPASAPTSRPTCWAAEDRPGRQPGAEPVHHRARLAVRLGRLHRADGAHRPAGVDLPAPRKRAAADEALAGGLRRRRSSRFCICRCSRSPCSASTPAIHASGKAFRFSWYARDLSRPATARSHVEQHLIALAVDRAFHRRRHALRLWALEARLAAAHRRAVSLAGHAGDRHRHLAAGALPVERSAGCTCSSGCYTVILAHVAFSHLPMW